MSVEHIDIDGWRVSTSGWIWHIEHLNHKLPSPSRHLPNRKNCPVCGREPPEHILFLARLVNL